MAFGIKHRLSKGVKKDPDQINNSDKNLAEIPPLKGRIALVMDNSIDYLMTEWIGAKTKQPIRITENKRSAVTVSSISNTAMISKTASRL